MILMIMLRMTFIKTMKVQIKIQKKRREVYMIMNMKVMSLKRSLNNKIKRKMNMKIWMMNLRIIKKSMKNKKNKKNRKNRKNRRNRMKNIKINMKNLNNKIKHNMI